MAYVDAKEIAEFLKDKRIKDIAIAIMNIEKNNNGVLTEELYQEYSKHYDEYFEARDDLTGILNETLQAER